MNFLSRVVSVFVFASAFIMPVFIISSSLLTAQQRLLPEGIKAVEIPAAMRSKLLSGDLPERIALKKDRLNGLEKGSEAYSFVFIYFSQYPAEHQLQELEGQGIRLYRESWIPPLPSHPLGYMIARITDKELLSLLSNELVVKVDNAERMNMPVNNSGAKSIKADQVWHNGWTGSGVRLAIIDTGLDTEPEHADLPQGIIKRDYSNYPSSIDNNIENTFTGHGTHVAGIALGRGTLSASNTINGGGPYKGMAPEADLIFLKAGSDASGSASANAILAAIHAAVDTFDADILSMSYGGWYTYHDGSSAEEQAVDWAYEKGKAFFIAASNDAGDGRHYSATVPGNSTTDYFRVDVTNAGEQTTALSFNLVWFDADKKNTLRIKYYNNTYKELPDVTDAGATESLRGTKSRFSHYNYFLPAGSSVYYLKVVNNSPTEQKFHIYENWGDGRVKFHDPDPDYTIGQPASADKAIAVGAYTTRNIWTASNGYSYKLNSSVVNQIASFSSRGPRVDELTKPDITAPGSLIISIRDRDVYTKTDIDWVDNDGIKGGEAGYMVMQGTSMACPAAAGAAALYFSRYPLATVQDLYSAIRSGAMADTYTGTVPNNIWGWGKLDILASVNLPLPVELSEFTSLSTETGVRLDWKTETELNLFGFEIQRKHTPDEWGKIGFLSSETGNSNSPRNYSFLDQYNIRAGHYDYRLKMIDSDGSFRFSPELSVSFSPVFKFSLAQNYPNPFNPRTLIGYSVESDGPVRLVVYDILGREVSVLVDGYKKAGRYSSVFDSRGLASGPYFYRLYSGSRSLTGKMNILK